MVRPRQFRARFELTWRQRLSSAARAVTTSLVVALAIVLLFAELQPELGTTLKALAVCAALSLVAGRVRLPILGRLLGLWQLALDIDGDYLVEVRSNAVRARRSSADAEARLYSKIGTARIDTRVSGVRMQLMSRKGRKCSEAVVCALRQDKTSNRPVLFYVFDSLVLDTTAVCRRHLGTACLTIPPGHRPAVLEGTYWTDRDWEEGRNTAGRIRFHRVSVGTGSSRPRVPILSHGRSRSPQEGE
ncbi:hypothetical protein AUC70_04420 [Methyloceanibacter stevinii]|uniref:SMODS-associating 2TM beta-strand rich effector domain-containing protein n=1 Tax=Methyloceanibacter stevinii TaxID=1774970 RepID=A0A1E3VN97_9HYPH|nr:hypothetical protein [Methyloceanibacter stevinii]ODR95005.1 hypothetical protein AUC70_04420 [Methyloceanibacter stevinii]